MSPLPTSSISKLMNMWLSQLSLNKLSIYSVATSMALANFFFGFITNINTNLGRRRTCTLLTEILCTLIIKQAHLVLCDMWSSNGQSASLFLPSCTWCSQPIVFVHTELKSNSFNLIGLFSLFNHEKYISLPISSSLT